MQGLQQLQPRPAGTLLVAAPWDYDGEALPPPPLPPPPPEDDDEPFGDARVSAEGTLEAPWETESRTATLEAPGGQREGTFAWKLSCNLSSSSSDNAPREVELLRGRPVKQAACGHDHTVIVMESSGDVWEWGAGPGIMVEEGEDGNSSGSSSHNPSMPRRVAALSGRHITGVACGNGHVVAVSALDEVWAWGMNQGGQLGMGDLTNRRQPARINSLCGRRVIHVVSLPDVSRGVF